ncbi:putative protein OS=Tsukamurella paurometabola (strain ATCC 8368 / DSM / CCUG 35730 /CIP 100753 / JCM 10117 / KCTC 9821 / NBRC 16120 / NCIMB 702349/ NCTC 13040) OX=521096 GN=Tpau_3888 PE=4 SV=1 [Tsukamurella paurometabola]|uniref:Uncharacterized protein n=1 Tax=Tsukamurella paurometabola (strain ATCC 8368 / DSM 20162 / CCUG 35730 / CIP 100753 / JCM 10117 / KCTC 9821 / NBRC 16120 / NCIMB 702349 / NCTC 13040) TaxID=521096 RepID=D5UMI7_TSUPD|nr:hypothetical protein [Tsukamurella paurometabola]ADG80461.1 hypothetical protein Tpau_3888 [Tsukamurella paurometabola DSM 20162]SUP39730.1 Uncharacterised protein [Tsukamurella paurometabola]
MSLDPIALKAESEKLGIDNLAELATAAGVSLADAARSIRPGGVPNLWLLRWLVSNNVDIRSMWRLDE